MGKLIYTAIMSLDGFIADAEGNFDWSAPDEEVHAFVNELEGRSGTYLLGRKMYEVMSWWEDLDTADEPQAIKDYADIWHAADKIVYSKSLEQPSTAKTRIEKTFDAGAVRALKASTERELSVGGAELAWLAVEAGLVDEFRFFLSPVTVGGGKRFLPDGVVLKLELLEERRFGNGVIYVSYRNLGA
jgi:dihydrofolate reductase